MKVGFTYDFKDDYLAMGFSLVDVAEFDTVETIEGIENSLKKLGFEVDRIGNVRSLAKRLVSGEKWDLVFNIAEGVSGIGRESQIPALLDAYSIPYVFSDPMVLSMTLHKGMAKRIVRDGGIKTPAFNIVYDVEDINKTAIPYPLFAKPLSEGTGKGIGALSMINSKEDLEKSCLHLLREHKQPVLVEKFLPGREFTVGITGTGSDAKVVGVIEINFLPQAESVAYGLVNKKNYEKLMKYTVPEKNSYDKCCETALKAWRILECRDGGRIDLRNNEFGEPEFIEVNPLAGLNPIDSDLPILSRMNGLDYDSLIKQIMDSAIKRIFNGKT
ncbi:MAG TPA: D-alanine--D-alanine ligase [bacterium]|nr:D-alanine--D-alanine ligase [bacterium]HPS29124.1 D-alanine--D-alanine ligase [bacterium]